MSCQGAQGGIPVTTSVVAFCSSIPPSNTAGGRVSAKSSREVPGSRFANADRLTIKLNADRGDVPTSAAFTKVVARPF